MAGQHTAGNTQDLYITQMVNSIVSAQLEQFRTQYCREDLLVLRKQLRAVRGTEERTRKKRELQKICAAMGVDAECFLKGERGALDGVPTREELRQQMAQAFFAIYQATPTPARLMERTVRLLAPQYSADSVRLAIFKQFLAGGQENLEDLALGDAWAWVWGHKSRKERLSALLQDEKTAQKQALKGVSDDIFDGLSSTDQVSLTVPEQLILVARQDQKDCKEKDSAGNAFPGIALSEESRRWVCLLLDKAGVKRQGTESDSALMERLAELLSWGSCRDGLRELLCLDDVLKKNRTQLRKQFGKGETKEEEQRLARTGIAGWISDGSEAEEEKLKALVLPKAAEKKLDKLLKETAMAGTLEEFSRMSSAEKIGKILCEARRLDRIRKDLEPEGYSPEEMLRGAREQLQKLDEGRSLDQRYGQERRQREEALHRTLQTMDILELVLEKEQEYRQGSSSAYGGHVLTDKDRRGLCSLLGDAQKEALKQKETRSLLEQMRALMEDGSLSKIFGEDGELSGKQKGKFTIEGLEKHFRAGLPGAAKNGEPEKRKTSDPADEQTPIRRYLAARREIEHGEEKKVKAQELLGLVLSYEKQFREEKGTLTDDDRRGLAGLLKQAGRKPYLLLDAALLDLMRDRLANDRESLRAAVTAPDGDEKKKKKEEKFKALAEGLERNFRDGLRAADRENSLEGHFERSRKDSLRHQWLSRRDAFVLMAQENRHALEVLKKEQGGAAAFTGLVLSPADRAWHMETLREVNGSAEGTDTELLDALYKILAAEEEDEKKQSLLQGRLRDPGFMAAQIRLDFQEQLREWDNAHPDLCKEYVQEKKRQEKGPQDTSERLQEKLLTVARWDAAAKVRSVCYPGIELSKEQGEWIARLLISAGMDLEKGEEKNLLRELERIPSPSRARNARECLRSILGAEKNKGWAAEQDHALGHSSGGEKGRPERLCEAALCGKLSLEGAVIPSRPAVLGSTASEMLGEAGVDARKLPDQDKLRQFCRVLSWEQGLSRELQKDAGAYVQVLEDQLLAGLEKTKREGSTLEKRLEEAIDYQKDKWKDQQEDKEEKSRGVSSSGPDALEIFVLMASFCERELSENGRDLHALQLAPELSGWLDALAKLTRRKGQPGEVLWPEKLLVRIARAVVAGNGQGKKLCREISARPERVLELEQAFCEELKKLSARETWMDRIRQKQEDWRGNEPPKERTLDELYGNRRRALERALDARGQRRPPRDLLSLCMELAEGRLRTGVTRRRLWFFALFFGMTVDLDKYEEEAAAPLDAISPKTERVEWEWKQHDVERVLFQDYYSDNMLRFLSEMARGKKDLAREQEPTGEGINYKDYRECTWVYFLVGADQLHRYPDEKPKNPLMTPVERAAMVRQIIACCGERGGVRLDSDSTTQTYRNLILEELLWKEPDELVESLCAKFAFSKAGEVTDDVLGKRTASKWVNGRLGLVREEESHKKTQSEDAGTNQDEPEASLEDLKNAVHWSFGDALREKFPQEKDFLEVVKIIEERISPARGRIAFQDRRRMLRVLYELDCNPNGDSIKNITNHMNGRRRKGSSEEKQETSMRALEKEVSDTLERLGQLGYPIYIWTNSQGTRFCRLEKHSQEEMDAELYDLLLSVRRCPEEGDYEVTNAEAERLLTELLLQQLRQERRITRSQMIAMHLFSYANVLDEESGRSFPDFFADYARSINPSLIKARFLPISTRSLVDLYVVFALYFQLSEMPADFDTLLYAREEEPAALAPEKITEAEERATEERVQEPAKEESETKKKESKAPEKRGGRKKKKTGMLPPV